MRGFGTTIFAEMSALAVQTGSINLGQGFPDTDGPPELLAAAADAILTGHNQYPPGPGIPELRQAIAGHQQRHYGLSYDPDADFTDARHYMVDGQIRPNRVSDPRLLKALREIPRERFLPPRLAPLAY
ncbi:MAG: aminotransferase class I/II-fold pyridoxal phosphate-dependent enzyme, partial [Jatrophihabitantaceae bacterium]